MKHCPHCGEALVNLFGEEKGGAENRIWECYQRYREKGVGVRRCHERTFHNFKPKITARLKSFEEREILDSIEELFESPFHLEKGFIGLEYVVRSDQAVQRWLDVRAQKQVDYESMGHGIDWEEE